MQKHEYFPSCIRLIFQHFRDFANNLVHQSLHWGRQLGCAPPGLLAGAPAIVLPVAGAGGGGGVDALPGTPCAMARCCCNGKMLGQIENSTAPILETMPKEARDNLS